MALSENIANLFRPSQKSAASAPAGPATKQPTHTPEGMPIRMANPGADPSNQNLGGGDNDPLATPKKDVNPLDSFTDLFTITDEDKKKVPPDPFGEPLLTFDSKKFGEASSKMNFASSIPPELMQKALGGDQQAFSTVLNRISQSTFTAAAQVFTGILEQSVKKNNSRWDNALESRFKTLQLSSQRPSNTALQHPAAQPVVEALKATIAAKNPSLRPDEVTLRAEEYFSNLADSLVSARPPKEGDKTTKPVETDWTQYLGS